MLKYAVAADEAKTLRCLSYLTNRAGANRSRPSGPRFQLPCACQQARTRIFCLHRLHLASPLPQQCSENSELKVRPKIQNILNTCAAGGLGLVVMHLCGIASRYHPRISEKWNSGPIFHYGFAIYTAIAIVRSRYLVKSFVFQPKITTVKGVPPHNFLWGLRW